MPIRVLIPTALRNFSENRDSLALEGERVRDVLESLGRNYPDLAQHLFDPEGKLRSFVNIYVNDEDIRHLDRENTLLADGDVLTIVPAVAGGSRDKQSDDERLSPEEIQRYSRHLIIPEVGVPGQLKLKQAKVLLVGAGGLGSPVALYLAAAGVGRMGLVDFDVVDRTNLQRQIIHFSKDVGRPKLESAQEKIRAVNPHVTVDTYEIRLSSENALEILAAYDVVIDGTDNFPTRYLVNDACVLLGKPNVYGSIFRFEGQASVFQAGRGPCYRCLYPEPPPPGLVPSCAEGGVLGILPGIIGLIQANEAVKLILGQGRSLVGRLLLYDALAMSFRELKVKKDPACPVCGEHPTVTRLIDYQAFCRAEAPAEEARLEPVAVVGPAEAKAQLESRNGVLLLDVREPHEFEICRIADAVLVPLARVGDHLGEWGRDREIIVYCRSGIRSAKAVRLLRDAGFTKARNLEGGILAWARDIDPTLPVY
jgi:adenylyltransferase/sulfurtransferase